MKSFRRIAAVFVAIGLTTLVLFPSLGAAAESGVIRGIVRDSTGSPVFGAVVVAARGVPMFERRALTDRFGSFILADLSAGQYSVRVMMPWFLTAEQNGIRLSAGATKFLAMNLQTALEVVGRATQGARISEDMLWTLRSSRSDQPVLRFAKEYDPSSSAGNNGSPDYSGYVQVYSKSVETSGAATEGMGSQFSVTMPLQSNSKVTVVGQYNDSPEQPRGIGVVYEFSPMDHHRSRIGVNVRQTAQFLDPLQRETLKEMQVLYDERFQYSDHFVIDVGAELGRADAYIDRSANRTYLRPRATLTLVPESRTTISAGVSYQAPAAPDDPIRGKDYFDKAIHIPPALEQYSHGEITLSRLSADNNTRLSVSVFRDRSNTQALFVSRNDGRRGVLILDASQVRADGVRVQLDHDFNAFSAGVGYTNAAGMGMAQNGAAYRGGPQQRFAPRRFSVVTARFHTDFDLTNTELTAVYRWMSHFSASQVDPYQKVVEFNEPTLTLTMAQTLPTGRTFPGKVQAVIDARNVFEQSFRTGHFEFAQAPRLIKGGINIQF